MVFAVDVSESALPITSFFAVDAAPAASNAVVSTYAAEPKPRSVFACSTVTEPPLPISCPRIVTF